MIWRWWVRRLTVMTVLCHYHQRKHEEDKKLGGGDIDMNGYMDTMRRLTTVTLWAESIWCWKGWTWMCLVTVLWYWHQSKFEDDKKMNVDHIVNMSMMGILVMLISVVPSTAMIIWMWFMTMVMVTVRWQRCAVALPVVVFHMTIIMTLLMEVLSVYRLILG